MKKMIKIIARIRLLFAELKIATQGGLAKPEVWRQKEALESIVNTKPKARRKEGE